MQHTPRVPNRRVRAGTLIHHPNAWRGWMDAVGMRFTKPDQIVSIYANGGMY